MNSKKAIMQFRAIKKLVSRNEMRLASEWNSKYKILIATILSAQTRDETTVDVCKVLFEKYPSMITLSKARISSVEKIIRRVNYHKTKAKKYCCGCKKCFPDGEFLKTTEELVGLPGVGRKVANVYLATAHKMDVIGVDTHVKRISFKLGWTKNKSQNKIEIDLMKLFPRKYWGEINDTLVRFGRGIGKSKTRENEILIKLIN